MQSPSSCDVAGFAENAVVEFFAALGRPLQQFDRAIDGDALFITGDQKRDRAFWLAAAGFEIIERGRDGAGNAALHVDRAAAVQEAIPDLTGERLQRPRLLIARRHDVGVAGKGDMRRATADARIEIIDVRSAGFREHHALHGEAGSAERGLQNAERAGIRRRHRRATHEIACQRESISHGSRLARAPQDVPEHRDHSARVCEVMSTATSP